MNVHPALNNAVHVAQAAIDLIKQAGIDEDDPDFEQLVASECDALERVRRILRSARMAEADAKTLAAMIEDMKSRKARFVSKGERLRDVAKWALEEMGVKRIDAPDFTATLSTPRAALVIVDEAALPDDLCRIKREPNKTAIREAIENGRTLDGAAYLGNPRPALTLRTK